MAEELKTRMRASRGRKRMHCGRRWDLMHPEKDDAHEAHPEIEIEEVSYCFRKKGYRQT